MGVSKIYTLSRIPPEMMQQVMGKNGLVIWKRANGIDNTPVEPYSERKSISHETTFDKDTIDVARMNEILVSMTEKLGYQLRKQQKLASVVTVKIRYSNYDTHTQQKRIPYTAFDHELMTVARDLFARLYQRRMLIRLIGVRVSGLVGGQQQLNMFEDTPEMTGLYQAMDRIRNRYGSKSVRRAVGI
jgi:DNA polymerase-4